jgi:hypothetical protein
VASANRCRTVWAENLGFVTVVGAETELNVVELLTTSLLVQANRAMPDAGRHVSSRRIHGRDRFANRSSLDTPRASASDSTPRMQRSRPRWRTAGYFPCWRPVTGRPMNSRVDSFRRWRGARHRRPTERAGVRGVQRPTWLSSTCTARSPDSARARPTSSGAYQKRT